MRLECGGAGRELQAQSMNDLMDESAYLPMNRAVRFCEKCSRKLSIYNLETLCFVHREEERGANECAIVRLSIAAEASAAPICAEPNCKTLLHKRASRAQLDTYCAYHRRHRGTIGAK